MVLGCNMPMLLRPTAGKEYEVIGDCYGEYILKILLLPLSSRRRPFRFC